MTEPLGALPLEILRRRTSTKWATHPDDVLPLFVAETDFALAEPITRILTDALAIGDTGYVPPKTAYPDAFAGFASRRWGWDVDPARVRTTCDVMMGVAEAIRAVAEPGEKVVVTSPVYPPFFDVHDESRTVCVDVPLLRENDGWDPRPRWDRERVRGRCRRDPARATPTTRPERRTRRRRWQSSRGSPNATVRS